MCVPLPALYPAVVVLCVGSHGVHLEISAHNLRAKLFYKKIGFKVLKFEMNGSGKGTPPEDVLILVRQL